MSWIRELFSCRRRRACRPGKHNSPDEGKSLGNFDSGNIEQGDEKESDINA
jgi:hypothetical protein